jgi:hypothetical protein
VGTRATLERCRLDANRNRCGLFVRWGATVSVVDGCEITGNEGSGVLFWDEGSGGEIADSDLTRNAKGGLAFDNGARHQDVRRSGNRE